MTLTKAGIARLQENAPEGTRIYDDSPLPPVNVRAEQVHRIRVALTNLQASTWNKLDLAESASLSYEIGELIKLERALGDKS
jgi:hypothetical protein